MKIERTKYIFVTWQLQLSRDRKKREAAYRGFIRFKRKRKKGKLKIERTKYIFVTWLGLSIAAAVALTKIKQEATNLGFVLKRLFTWASFASQPGSQLFEIMTSDRIIISPPKKN